MAKKTQDFAEEGVVAKVSTDFQMKSPAMDLDADVSGETKHQFANDDLQPAAAPARQGDAGRPFCGKHNCLMKATGSSKTETRYACPVPLCDAKEKRARSSVNIPREP